MECIGVAHSTRCEYMYSATGWAVGSELTYDCSYRRNIVRCLFNKNPRTNILATKLVIALAGILSVQAVDRSCHSMADSFPAPLASACNSIADTILGRNERLCQTQDWWQKYGIRGPIEGCVDVTPGGLSSLACGSKSLSPSAP